MQERQADISKTAGFWGGSRTMVFSQEFFDHFRRTEKGMIRIARNIQQSRKRNNHLSRLGRGNGLVW
jgi:hypothetical protein